MGSVERNVVRKAAGRAVGMVAHKAVGNVVRKVLGMARCSGEGMLGILEYSLHMLVRSRELVHMVLHRVLDNNHFLGSNLCLFPNRRCRKDRSNRSNGCSSRGQMRSQQTERPQETYTRVSYETPFFNTSARSALFFDSAYDTIINWKIKFINFFYANRYLKPKSLYKSLKLRRFKMLKKNDLWI